MEAAGAGLDTVTSVALTYPEGSFPELRERLTSALGAPVHEEAEPDRRVLLWGNREASVFLYRSGPAGGDGRVRVVVSERPGRRWYRAPGRR